MFRLEGFKPCKTAFWIWSLKRTFIANRNGDEPWNETPPRLGTCQGPNSFTLAHPDLHSETCVSKRVWLPHQILEIGMKLWCLLPRVVWSLIALSIGTLLFWSSLAIRNRISLVPNIALFSCYKPFHYDNISAFASPKFIKLNLSVQRSNGRINKVQSE